MINLIDIKSYIPNNKLDNSLNYKKINKNFLLKKIGTIKVPRINKKKEDIISMCVKAFKKIDEKMLHNIKSIVLCTQNPEYNGLPHNSAILQSKLKKISNKITDDISCLDISHGCSGFIYSMKIIEGLLKHGERGLIFTCDPYSKIIKPRDRSTELIFGDAAAVTLVQNNRNLISAYDFYTNGDYAKSLININGKLNMNGRNVLDFCMENVPKLLNKILSKNKIDRKDIKYFFFHQGSKYIITSLRKKLNISSDKMPLQIKNIGNTVSSSIPITLQRINLDKIKRPIILCGFGVGLSVSICLLK